MGRIRTRTLLQTYKILADPHDNPLPPDPSTTPLDNNNNNNNNKQEQPFDSSMGLTILVLLSALFLMGFFSIYTRRFAHESPVDLSRRRRLRSGLFSTSVSATSRLCTRKGLDFEAIHRLPIVEYSLLGLKIGSGKKKLVVVVDCCAVCLAEFEEGESVKMLPFCHHLFHVECIDTWLVARASCPVCRTSKILEEVDRVSVAAEMTEASGVGVRRCCSCSDIGAVEEGRGGLQRTRSL